MKAYIVVSVQFLWCVQYLIQWWEEAFQPTIHDFFFDNLDVDGAAYNLNKMMKIPFSLCALMYHISVKLYLCKDVC